MMKTQTRRRLALAGSAIVLATALSGCSAIQGLLSGGDAPRDEESGQVTESSNIDVFKLKVGDCMMESTSGLIEDVDVTPCGDPHDEEVFYEIKMPEGKYDEAAVDTASQECIGQPFADFVGVAFDSSALDVYPITPTQDTWEQLNDRVIQCVVYEDGVQTTGTLKGAAR